MRKTVQKKSAPSSRVVTNTHLVVSVLAMLAAGGAALATLVSAATVNTVQLQAGRVCRQAGEYGYNRSFKGVEIVNASTASVVSRLANGCRDAGYGLRQYTFTCNSNPNTYTVAWTACASTEVLTPQVQVSLDSSSPATRLVTPTGATTTLAVFTLTASVADADVRSIAFTALANNSVQGSFRDYLILTLEDENGRLLGSVVPADNKPVIRINPYALQLRAGISQRVFLRALFMPFAPGAIGGRLTGYKIAASSDVVANGVTSGVVARVTLASASLNGNPQYLYKGVPTVEILPLNNQLNNGMTDLLKFRVTAVNSDVDLYKFSFDVATTTASVRYVQLVDVTENSEQVLSYAWSGAKSYTWVPASRELWWNINTVINPVRTVSASRSRTFVLRGEVSGVSAGSVVVTRLGGDSALPTVGGYGTTAMMLPVDVLDTDANNDFIWSDRSSSAHTASTTDWINGYKVSGLAAPKSSPSVVAR